MRHLIIFILYLGDAAQIIEYLALIALSTHSPTESSYNILKQQLWSLTSFTCQIFLHRKSQCYTDTLISCKTTQLSDKNSLCFRQS